MTPISIQYTYRIFADPFINHTNYHSLSPPALEAPLPLFVEDPCSTPGSKLIVRTYLHLSTAEGRGFLLWDDTGNTIMFSGDYIYALRMPSGKHSAKLLRTNILHRKTE